MRVFALSDIHVDFAFNARWIRQISRLDYRDDVLILAGDVAHKLALLDWCLRALVACFKKVLFVPGNHDLWVLGERNHKTSLHKSMEVAATVEASGASMEPFLSGDALIAPLFGWYDGTFGEPSAALKEIWMDYHACRWPTGFGPEQVGDHFARLNIALAPRSARRVITFSHFLPRLDLLPQSGVNRSRLLQPVMGSTRLEQQLRRLRSNVHVYGHSHINRSVEIDGVTYINNALGYPRETGIASRRLLCIDEI
jgi:predicted phosphodiesterase